LTTAAAVGLLAAPALAQDATPAPVTVTVTTPAPPDVTPYRKPPFRPWYVYVSYGINAMTYTAASGTAPSSTTGPGDKFIQFEQFGLGYWVHPNIRVQLTGMFGETLSGLKPGMSEFTLGAVIPCAFYTLGGFAVGGGPMFAPRAFGADAFNFGIFSVASYGFKLGAGLSLALAVQVPVFLTQKESVAVTPAINLSERF
jgi:hypothetical protein